MQNIEIVMFELNVSKKHIFIHKNMNTNKHTAYKSLFHSAFTDTNHSYFLIMMRFLFLI